MNNNKELLKELFQAVFASKDFDESVIERYFSKDYHQWVDGHELDYQGFVAHIAVQKKRVERVNIHFESMVAEGDKVATIHSIDAMTKDGHPVQGRVVAQFRFKDNKLINCEELTYFSTAREQDRDLGSAS